MMQIYVIYDSAAQVYSKPMLFLNDKVAIRVMIDSMEQDSIMRNNPEHFSLWNIGYYYEDDGIIETYETEGRRVIVRLHELAAQRQIEGVEPPIAVNTKGDVKNAQ